MMWLTRPGVETVTSVWTRQESAWRGNRQILNLDHRNFLLYRGVDMSDREITRICTSSWEKSRLMEGVLQGGATREDWDSFDITGHQSVGESTVKKIQDWWRQAAAGFALCPTNHWSRPLVLITGSKLMGESQNLRDDIAIGLSARTAFVPHSLQRYMNARVQ
ncbi:hypothetical protein RRG08_011150 [Elysia crispata]|uniref:Uncharacterized protein n=1 Tax=Elysia crispata TaxID=231223 RepID=A0AAE1A261_9GAST|nr:hypothetical protein RRG08_011150 [Elysia crispata]